MSLSAAQLVLKSKSSCRCLLSAGITGTVAMPGSICKSNVAENADNISRNTLIYFSS